MSTAPLSDAGSDSTKQQAALTVVVLQAPKQFGACALPGRWRQRLLVVGCVYAVQVAVGIGQPLPALIAGCESVVIAPGLVPLARIPAS